MRLRFTTAGESHGKGLVVIVEGMPAGVPIDAAWVDRDLGRRMQGHGRGARMKIVILGAGQVGASVAESLVSEQNDITVVDIDAARLRFVHALGGDMAAPHREAK